MRAERAVRVLVVEADPGNAGVLGQALEMEGHVAVHAATAEDAPRLATEGGWGVCAVDGSAPARADPADEGRALYRVLATAAPVVVTTAPPRSLAAAVAVRLGSDATQGRR